MNVDIRPASPDDAPFLAWVMLTAGRSHVGRGIWDIAIENTEKERLAFLETAALTEKPQMLHYSNFIIAVVDGRSAAALSGFDPSERGMESLKMNLGEIAGKMGWTKEFVDEGWQRIQPCLTCHPEETPGAWIVECVATWPEFRRKGIINLLLERILETGREKGFGLAQVSVLMGNTPAIRAYESVGFEVKKEYRHPDFEAVIGEPGSLLMMRDL